MMELGDEIELSKARVCFECGGVVRMELIGMEWVCDGEKNLEIWKRTTQLRCPLKPSPCPSSNAVLTVSVACDSGMEA